jgi:hypothetical protein
LVAWDSGFSKQSDSWWLVREWVAWDSGFSKQSDGWWLVREWVVCWTVGGPRELRIRQEIVFGDTSADFLCGKNLMGLYVK